MVKPHDENDLEENSQATPWVAPDSFYRDKINYGWKKTISTCPYQFHYYYLQVQWSLDFFFKHSQNASNATNSQLDFTFERWPNIHIIKIDWQWVLI